MRARVGSAVLFCSLLSCGQLQAEGETKRESVPAPARDPCERAPAAAERPRKVVISHPFKSGPASRNRADVFAVWELSADGELARTPQRFAMGRAADGQDIVFTPDGRIGVVVQEDGSLGVFRFTPDGVEVIHAAFTGDLPGEPCSDGPERPPSLCARHALA